MADFMVDLVRQCPGEYYQTTGEGFVGREYTAAADSEPGIEE
ncbi:MAG: hypothetical protein AB1611_06010 [bacterium]